MHMLFLDDERVIVENAVLVYRGINFLDLIQLVQGKMGNQEASC